MLVRPPGTSEVIGHREARNPHRVKSYGRLARDCHVHAVSLLDALAFERAVDTGWTSNRIRANAVSNPNTGLGEEEVTGGWTLGGRRDSFSSPLPITKGADQQELPEAL